MRVQELTVLIILDFRSCRIGNRTASYPILTTGNQDSEVFGSAERPIVVGIIDRAPSAVRSTQALLEKHGRALTAFSRLL
jgi:hypothetical protein